MPTDHRGVARWPGRIWEYFHAKTKPCSPYKDVIHRGLNFSFIIVTFSLYFTLFFFKAPCMPTVEPTTAMEGAFPGCRVRGAL